MKNIHILPTEKPSRLLYFGTSKELTLQVNPATFRVFERSPQHIYITSDEEIKKGDWVITNGGFRFVTKLNNDKIKSFIDDGTISKQFPSPYCRLEYYKKIILTTDLDLIGVQTIDDEFLEWFVKNPSCESVEVKHQHIDEIGIGEEWACHPKNNNDYYKIIIPKEEQKQHIIDMMKSDEELGLYEQTKCYCGHITTCDCGPEQEITLEDIFNEEKKQGVKELIDKHKQETLEEVAERLFPKEKYPTSFKTLRKAFISNVKWQQERSYSEENMIAFGEFIFKHTLLAHSKGVKNLFEQFKKK